MNSSRRPSRDGEEDAVVSSANSMYPRNTQKSRQIQSIQTVHSLHPHIVAGRQRMEIVVRFRMLCDGMRIVTILFPGDQFHEAPLCMPGFTVLPLTVTADGR